MKIYEAKLRFFVSPLKRYIPAGAVVARYENATKIVIVDDPRSDLDPFNTLVDGFEYDDPAQVTWIYELEPSPLGTNDDFFTLTGQKDEDEFGNTGATGDGLPPNSLFRIRTSDNMPYIYNADSNLWYPVRIAGLDGNVRVEVGQNGIPEASL